jgi:hypothetical protein
VSCVFTIRFLDDVGKGVVVGDQVFEDDDVTEDIYVCVVVYVDDIDVVTVELVDTVA